MEREYGLSIPELQYKKGKISFTKKSLNIKRFEIIGVEFCNFQLVEVDI